MQKLEQKEVEVDGETLFCEFTLADENAVILHGAGQSSRKRYYAIAEELLKQGVGVILFDFSGHGDSTGDLKELSLERRKKQAISVINTLIPPESPLYLVGFSMGAQTACDLLPLYGRRVKALLLACPAIYRADVQKLPFGESAFTAKLREPNSWRSTNATKYLVSFEGKTVIAIGSDDAVIPKDVVLLLRGSAKHLVYKEYAGATHAFAPWLSEHPDELSLLITQLLRVSSSVN